MSIEALNTACLARRVRLSQARWQSRLAAFATLAVFAFILVASFGGLKP